MINSDRYFNFMRGNQANEWKLLNLNMKNSNLNCLISLFPCFSLVLLLLFVWKLKLYWNKLKRKRSRGKLSWTSQNNETANETMKMRFYSFSIATRKDGTHWLQFTIQCCCQLLLIYLFLAHLLEKGMKTSRIETDASELDKAPRSICIINFCCVYKTFMLWGLDVDCGLIVCTIWVKWTTMELQLTQLDIDS